MVTKNAKKAAAYAAQVEADEIERKTGIMQRRDDSSEKIDALKAMRDRQVKTIQDVAAEQVATTKTMFSELIAAETRRYEECNSELRALDGDDAAEGEGAGHNSKKGTVTTLPGRSKAAEG
jgi:hypothetical protein